MRSSLSGRAFFISGLVILNHIAVKEGGKYDERSGDWRGPLARRVVSFSYWGTLLAKEGHLAHYYDG
jgi:hypothetical protein